MKEYQVIITESAIENLEDIYEYIAFKLQSPNVASSLYQKIKRAIFSLNVMPFRYKITDIEPGRSQGLHQMRVENYYVFYLIIANKVYVTNILYCQPDISARLTQDEEK